MVIDNDKVVRLRRKDYKKAVNIIVEAFMSYPIPGSFIGDQNRRRIALYEMFKIEIKQALKKGYVLTLGGDYKEVSVWNDNTLIPSNLSYIRYLSLSSLRLLSAIRGREMKNLSLYFEEVMRIKKSLILPDKTAELFILAVDPNNQGEGRSSSMIRPILEELSTQGISCLVLTNTESNCNIYKKLGFNLIEYFVDNRSNIATYFLLKS